MSSAKTILLTGGTGFIGSKLAKRMLDDGCRVNLVVRKMPAATLPANPESLRYHLLDGTTRKLIEIVEKVQPDVVYHLASLFIAEHQPDQVQPLVESNILFGVQLLEAARQNNVKRLINVGTSWQHYHSESRRPSCLYAATKQAYEDIVTFYCDTYGMSAISLKLFDTYGPDDRRAKLFALLRNALKSNQALAMSGGEQKIDLVYIDDVLDAFDAAEERLLQQSQPLHECFGVTSGHPLPLRQLVELYQEVICRHIEIHWGARPYRAREIMDPWDGSPVVPGWTPQVALRDGLLRMHRADMQHDSGACPG